MRQIPNLLTHHKSVVKDDIKTAMKIIQNMDKRWNLWQEEGVSGVDELSSSLVDNEADEPPKEKTKEDNDKQMDSESTETANLEKAAFSKLVSSAPKFLSHKV